VATGFDVETQLDDHRRTARFRTRGRPTSAGHLTPRYLLPSVATVADIQAWCGRTGLGQVVSRRRDQLRIFEDEQGRELFDVPGAPLSDPRTPAPVRFLPPFDNAILGTPTAPDHRPEQRDFIDRHRLLRTFLVDGFLAGTWQVDGTAGTRSRCCVGKCCSSEWVSESSSRWPDRK